MRPCTDRRHDLPAETLTVRAFLHPEAQFRRFRVALFQRGHAKAFLAVAPSDDKGKCIWLRSPQSFFASCDVFAPGWGSQRMNLVIEGVMHAKTSSASVI